MVDVTIVAAGFQGPEGAQGPTGPIGSVDSGLDGLNDVTITGLASDVELLAYITGSGEWENRTVVELGLLTTAHDDPLTHFTQAAISITESQISDLQAYLTKTAADLLYYPQLTADGLFEPLNVNIQAHIASTSNPHGLDKTDVGLTSVLDVVQEPALGNPSVGGYVLSSDAGGVRSWIAQPTVLTDHTALSNIGTNSHAAIDLHIADIDNPHSVDKADVGLASVLNIAQEPDLGAPSVTGYVLSSNTGGIRSWVVQPTVLTDHTQLTRVGTNTHAQIDTHLVDSSNPHSVTYAQLPDKPTHGDLTGLGDDDHTQYHNDVRGDARYLQLTGGTLSGALTVSYGSDPTITVQPSALGDASVDMNDYLGVLRGRLRYDTATGDVRMSRYNSSGVLEATVELVSDGNVRQSVGVSPAHDNDLTRKAYVDALVSSAVVYKGGYDAATNTPDLDVSPSGVLVGHMYSVTVAGDFYATAVGVGDTLIAEVDDPASVGDWSVISTTLDAGTILSLLLTVDGPSSLLDADFLDGIDSSAFLRSDENDTTTGTLTISLDDAAPLILSRATQVGIKFDQTSYVRYLGSASGVLTYGTDVNHSLNPAIATENYVDTEVAGLSTVYEPINSNIQAHIVSSANPHGVTATQVSLGNVDNTSDVNKPVSTAQQTALDLKVTKTGDAMSGTLSINRANTQLLLQSTDNTVSETYYRNSGGILRGIIRYEHNSDSFVVKTYNTSGVFQNNFRFNESGTLTLPVDPTGALDATTKQYVDNADGLKVNLAGDTMTGALGIETRLIVKSPIDTTSQIYFTNSSDINRATVQYDHTNEYIRFVMYDSLGALQNSFFFKEDGTLTAEQFTSPAGGYRSTSDLNIDGDAFSVDTTTKSIALEAFGVYRSGVIQGGFDLLGIAHSIHQPASDDDLTRKDYVDAGDIASTITALTAADDLDNLVSNGHYQWTTSVPANAPSDVSNMYKIMNVSLDGGQPQQMVWGGADGLSLLATRRRDSSVWKAWEYYAKKSYVVANFLGISDQADDSVLFDGLPQSDFITKASGIVAEDIHTTGAITYAQGGGVRILQPQGAFFTTGTNTLTGYIKITLPVTWNNTMLRFDLDIYDYAGTTDGESIKLHMGGYNYLATSTWNNVFAHIITSRSDKFFNVRFGHDGTNCAVYIGEAGSTWNYPQMAVTNVVAGFNGASEAAWADGWSIEITPTLGTNTTTAVAELTANYALNSGLLAGAAADTAPGNSTIVKRDTSGDIYVRYINTTANATSGVPTNIMVETGSDSFIRKQSPTNFRVNMTDAWYLGKTATAADSTLLAGVVATNYARTDIVESFASDVTILGTLFAGDIGVTGLVDGRDVAADGATLDAIGAAVGGVVISLDSTPGISKRIGSASLWTVTRIATGRWKITHSIGHTDYVVGAVINLFIMEDIALEISNIFSNDLEVHTYNVSTLVSADPSAAVAHITVNT